MALRAIISVNAKPPITRFELKLRDAFTAKLVETRPSPKVAFDALMIGQRIADGVLASLDFRQLSGNHRKSKVICLAWYHKKAIEQN